MVRGMARPFAPAVWLGLTLLAPPALAQAPPSLEPVPAPKEAGPASASPEQPERSLSPECRVPGSKLYTIASLRAVRRALRNRRAIKVLAIGSSSTAGVGASSPLASYPMRLESELEKLFPGVDMEVENRGISGEIAAGAADRMRGTIAEIQPDLVIWQVGTNDALARVNIEEFGQAVDETVRWIKSHGIDVVLVDPQYTRSLDQDEYYGAIVKSIQDIARKNRVPLVLRFEAMRYLAGQRRANSYLSRDQFHLNDLGYRCMAEHVARAITVSLLESDPVQPTPAPPAPESPPAPKPE